MITWLLGTGFWVFVGLMLGWLVIPQPAWAQKLVDGSLALVKRPFSKEE